MRNQSYIARQKVRRYGLTTITTTKNQFGVNLTYLFAPLTTTPPPLVDFCSLTTLRISLYVTEDASGKLYVT